MEGPTPLKPEFKDLPNNMTSEEAVLLHQWLQTKGQTLSLEQFVAMLKAESSAEHDFKSKLIFV